MTQGGHCPAGVLIKRCSLSLGSGHEATGISRRIDSGGYDSAAAYRTRAAANHSARRISPSRLTGGEHRSPSRIPYAGVRPLWRSEQVMAKAAPHRLGDKSRLNTRTATIVRPGSRARLARACQQR
jgi:hypothetical protein